MHPRPNAPAWLKNPFLVYGAAAVLTCVAVLVRSQMNGLLAEQSRYALLLPSVFACAVYGGVGPGLLTALLGGALTMTVLVTPGGAIGAAERKDIAGLVVYLLTCGAILWLTRREMAERERRMGVEARLESVNAELEAKVAERTAELKAANDELEGFCYSMAHDLRTPSRAIAGNARILLEDHAEKLSPELGTHLNRINKAALKLGALVDGLLTYARLAKQDLEIIDIDLVALAADVIADEGRRAKVEIHADMHKGPVIHADERQMRILIRALVDNALVYRRPGQIPSVSLTWLPDGTFVFADDGIGFDMAYAHKVFMPFERLHRDEAYPGVGMGLANVDRVVRRHGGTVSIDSVEGQGTRVSVRLPGVGKMPRKLAIGAGAS